jgi:hypothetical protein
MVDDLVMYKATIRTTSEYGVMFLHDSKKEPGLFEFLDESPVASDGQSLMFRVQIYVDGETDISIYEMGPTSVAGELFDFSIKSESKSISLSDHTGFNYINIPVRKNAIAGRIIYDDIRHPNKIDIEILDIYSY